VNWNSATGFFMIGLLLGAGGVWILNTTQQLQSDPIGNYLRSLPPISTSIPLKGG
jgi:hypothetical protein